MKKGFTLIELLVVIGIIGALAGFAISKLGSADKAMQLASMKQDVRAALPQFQVAAANSNGILAASTVDAEATIPATAHEISNTENDVKVQVSPNNTMAIATSATNCPDGGANYKITVSSSKQAKKVEYDSCADTAIRVIAAP